MSKGTRPEDYLGVLKSLTDEGCSYFLEGGQAVNFWAEYFTLRESRVIELEKYQPFTSKDCDLWVSMAALKHFEAKLDGKLKKGLFRQICGRIPARWLWLTRARWSF